MTTIPATLIPGALSEGVRVIGWSRGKARPGTYIGTGVHMLWNDDEGYRCDSTVLALDLTHWTAQHALVRALHTQGHNLRAFLPAPFGDARAEWAVGLLGCSARRVAAGLGPVAGVLGEWMQRLDLGPASRRESVLGAPHLLWVGRETTRVLGVDTGWAVVDVLVGIEKPGWIIKSGIETGDAGKSAADRAALLAGFALVNGDTLTLPEPTEAP